MGLRDEVNRLKALLDHFGGGSEVPHQWSSAAIPQHVVLMSAAMCTRHTIHAFDERCRHDCLHCTENIAITTQVISFAKYTQIPASLAMIYWYVNERTRIRSIDKHKAVPAQIGPAFTLHRSSTSSRQH